jgi:hypothetical protein
MYTNAHLLQGTNNIASAACIEVLWLCHDIVRAESVKEAAVWNIQKS